MFRPRVKSIFPPIPLPDGRIRLGSDLGIASEITDDDQGNIWHLLGLMDGTKDRHQLAEAMAVRHAAVTPDQVEGVINTLIGMGFVEDAAAPAPTALSAAEMERYARNLEFFGFFHQPGVASGDYQTRLRQATVTVLGVGGLGAYVALALTAIGVGKLHLVDDDVVELSNLNRQVLYTDADIGALKVEAAAARLRQVNPHCDITTHAVRVMSPDDARAVTKGCDLLVSAADRPRMLLYYWLNQAALETNVPWLRGGNDGLTVSLFLHVPHQTACFQCVEQEIDEEYPDLVAISDYVINQIGDRTINPCTAPVAGMIGNLAAFEAVKHLTGIAEPASLGRRFVLDIGRMSVLSIDGIKIDHCTACGTKPRETAGAQP